MGRRTRYLLNRTANVVEDGAGALVAFLRRKAERPQRVKPLAFETDTEQFLREIREQMIANYVGRHGFIDNLTKYTWDEADIRNPISFRKTRVMEAYMPNRITPYRSPHADD